MPESYLTITGGIGGISFNSTLARSADGQIGHDPELPAAKSGNLSTRTSDTAGTLTLEAGHGLLENDVVDLYWDGGMRYNVDVGVVAGNDVPISGGTGDLLPAQGTAVTVQKQQVIDTDFDGDELVALGALCSQRTHIGFYDGATLELARELTAGEVWHWLGDTGNPLAGKTITHVVVTQASTSATVFRLGILYDSTV